MFGNKLVQEKQYSRGTLLSQVSKRAYWVRESGEKRRAADHGRYAVVGK